MLLAPSYAHEAIIVFVWRDLALVDHDLAASQLTPLSPVQRPEDSFDSFQVRR